MQGDFYKKHFYILRNDANGNFKWIRNYPVSDSSDVGNALAIDTLGNVYVTGSRYDTLCNICTVPIKYSNIFVIKYDSLGNQKWIYRAYHPDSTQQYPADIHVDNNGIILITGNQQKYNYKTQKNISKLIVIKIMKNGMCNWQKYISSATGGTCITTDKEGTIIMGATDVSEYQLLHNMVVKLTSSGNLLFKAIFSEPNKNGRTFFVGTDNDGNIYTNGNSDTITFFNNPHILTLKYSPTGVLLWSRKEKDNTSTGLNLFGAFSCDASGNCYVTGYVHLSSINDDWIQSKYNSSGVQLFTTQNGSAINGADKPCGIAIDKGGYIYVTGYYANPIPKVSYGFATCKYSPFGSLLNTLFYTNGKGSSGFPIGIGLDGKNNIYVAGNSSVLTRGGSSSDGFITTVKYNNSSTTTLVKTNQIQNQLTFFLSPNPCNDYILVQLDEIKKYEVKIYSAEGTIEWNKKYFSSKEIKIPTSTLHTGVYTISITDGSSIKSQQFIKGGQ